MPKRRKKTRRRRRFRRGNPRSNPGIVSKINAALGGFRVALPAIGEVVSRGLDQGTPKRMLFRYAAYDIDSQKFNLDQAKTAAGFYSGFIIERKVMSALKAPQMASRKKILSIVGQYLPELMAVSTFGATGNPGEALNEAGRRSIGYQPTDHQSWIENPTVRGQWLSAFAGRIGLTLVSRFAGPMINRHLPKGINI